jgi:RimJ/RimL family protein N-acetyltransferase
VEKYVIGSETYIGEEGLQEDLTLILDFGFNNLELVRIYAKVLHPNLTSIRLLESAGFRYEGRIRKSLFR